MVEVIAESISVQFPIYDANTRSLRTKLMNISTGGTIRADAKHIVVTALDDVSFTLRRGDRLGIVGQNGAGKTTLLRVLAGIYEPTSGRMITRGKVAPLFDITLGMDPDATGYENIKIRGLFLDMTEAQIQAHTEEIVAFSELGPYMDMPIRTYSSGMMVRLAFAIATTQKPEILLLDEMIGAGDARFIDRAQARLDRFIGNTGILVLASHSEAVIRKMCNKAILLHQGKLIGSDSVDEILSSYNNLVRS